MKNKLNFFKSMLLVAFLVISSSQVKAQFVEGRFYRDNSNGRIYWRAFGKLRHIQSAATLNGLFSNATSSANMSDLPPVWTNNPDEIFGAPLTPDNGLINDVNTGRVYFRRGNVIHWITNPAVFDQYHFKWSAIQNVNGIGTFVLSPCSFPWSSVVVTSSPCW